MANRNKFRPVFFTDSELREVAWAIHNFTRKNQKCREIHAQRRAAEKVDTNMRQMSTTTDNAPAEDTERPHEFKQIISPMPDELCPHVELGADMVGGFVFKAQSPEVSVGMCAVCLAICQAEFITAEPFDLYRRASE